MEPPLLPPRLLQNIDANGRRRIVVVMKRLEDGQYQTHIRLNAGGNAIFYSRRCRDGSRAKREAETVFGPLDWEAAPERLRQSEPGINQVAYINL